MFAAVAQQCVGTCCLCAQVVINFFNSRLDSMKENSAAAPEDTASWNVNRVLELVQTFAQVGTQQLQCSQKGCASCQLAAGALIMLPAALTVPGSHTLHGSTALALRVDASTAAHLPC